MVKYKAFYLRMTQEMEEKEKARAYVAQVKRDRQVRSSGDEYKEMDNNNKKGKVCMVATSEEDGSTNLPKKYYYMA